MSFFKKNSFEQNVEEFEQGIRKLAKKLHLDDKIKAIMIKYGEENFNEKGEGIHENSEGTPEGIEGKEKDNI